MASRCELLAATGLVQTGSLRLKSVHLVAAAAAATLLIQDSAAGGGTDVIKLAADVNGNDHWVSGDPDGVRFSTALYGTLAGAGAVASFEFEE